MSKPHSAQLSAGRVAARLIGSTFAALAAAALLPGFLENGGLAQSSSCLPPISNPIVCENALTGNPKSEWDITGAGDTSIQGFATEISVNHGESIDFKVKTDAAQYQIDIYRLGYYGGNGARKVATVLPSAALPQVQPDCLTDAGTGLTDCGNWGVSASWSVPSDATSGVYIGRLVRTSNGGASHMVFIVRDDEHQSDLLFQTSDTTWQAYNDYGGNSLYTGAPAGRAYKVSYNRPFATRGNPFARAWLFDGDYPMIRWLEANGYFVSYTTGVDTDRRGAELLEHKAFLSVGHDEYWSGAQRTNVEAARAAGVHLAFFSGDAIFWKTRWENSIASPATAYRTLVSYKETHANAKIDPTAAWTGTWRDPRFSPPADGGQPENALTGTIFMGNCCGAFPLTVSEPQGKNRFWRNTSLATLTTGQSVDVAPGIVGYEFDADLDNGFRPQGLIRLSTTEISSYAQTLLDYGSIYGPGQITHAMTLYRHASGAIVFGAGLTRWAWALDTTHDQDSSTPGILPDAEPIIRQATVNLLADMGSQPLTLQPGLTASDPSLDTTAPTSTITAPANGSTVKINTPLTITGTASDTGGVVAAVEVSVDNGATWKAATGLTSWTFAWTPTALGAVTVKSRAVDDSGNVGAATPVNVTVSYGCPCTLWQEAETPAAFDTSGSTPLELGVKFTSQINGYITGIRFYKGPTNTGVHTGTLWSSGGTALATAQFAGETASGWQQVTFAVPVAVTANTTYVASYYGTTGHFSFDAGYFNTQRDRVPLHAPASPASGGNGVFNVGASGFPNQSFNANNYWVDVVFEIDVDFPPVVTARTPPSGSSAISPATGVTATFSDPMNATTISASTFELRDPSSALISATVSYNAGTQVATLIPSGQLAPMTTFTATVIGGAGGVQDETGHAMVGNSTWSFTTGGTFPCPCTLWPASATPAAFDTSGSTPLELGVKFQTEVGGFITALRFYKGPTDAGVHTANLWSGTGTLLATAPFTGETASGWQEVALPAAVAVTANTTYVVSYHTTSGFFAFDGGYFMATGRDAAPLHAPSSPAADGNGVFAVGATAFPTGTFNGNNYWVDAVFVLSLDTTAPTISARTPTPGATNVLPGASVTATFSEAMSATTITTGSFELRDPGNNVVPATVGYNSGTNVATLTPSSTLSELVTYTAKVLGGGPGVKDLVGNALAGDSSWSFTTVDVTAPTIVNVAPPTGATGVAASTAVTVTFSENVDALTVTTATFDLRDGSGPIAATVDYHSGTHVATLQPLSALTSGTLYTVRVVGGASGVKDPSGNPLASTMESSFTTADTIAPTVMAVVPTHGSTGVAGTTSVEVTFSEDVAGATVNTSTVELRDGANQLVSASVGYNSGLHKATLQPSATLASSGFYTLRVVGGASGVQDPAGNPLAADVTATFTIADTIAPTVTAVVPAHGAQGVLPTAPVTATFSEDVNAATVTSATFELRDSGNNLVPATVGYNSGTHVATLTPTSALGSSAVYTARVVGGVAGVKDPAGNPLAGDVTATFTTLDVIAPVVSGVTPMNGATGLQGTIAVTATFSEDMNPATITTATIELRDGASNLVPATVSYDGPSRTATLQPTSALAPATLHTIKVVGGGPTDLTGNPVAANFLSTFTTASAPPTIGARAIGTYNTNGSNENTTNTNAVTTQAATNFVMFVTGDRDDPPVVSDTYNNAWKQIGPALPAGGDGQGSQGHVWVMASLGAAGGPNHAFSTLRYTGFSSVLVVEVIGNVVLEGAAFGTDNAAPFTSPAVTIGDSALLLGAMAIGFPDGDIELAHGSGFANLDFIGTGEYWNLAVSSRTVFPGSYSTLETPTFTGGGWPDTPYALALLALRTRPPAGDTTLPAVSAIAPTAGAIGVTATTSPTITFSESLDVMTVNPATIQLRDPANTIVPATINFDGSTRTVTIDPSVSLVSFNGYSIRVVGGATGVKDLSGNAVAADVTWSFTTGLALPTIGATVTGAYNRQNSDENITVSTQPITTQPSTNFVMFLAGDDNATIPLPIITDSYGNTWTQVGTTLTNGGGGQGTPGKFWTFVALNAMGGPNHVFSALKYTSFTSMLVVEVLSDVALETSAFDLDGAAPFESGVTTLTREGLLLGAAAIGFPDGHADFSYANGFQPVNVVAAGENWEAVSMARTAPAGSYTSSMTYTLANGGTPDPPAAIALLGFVPESTAPYAIAATPIAETTDVPTNTVVTATFSERLLASSVNTGTFQLLNGANVLVPATVTYDDQTRTAILTPLAALQHGDTFMARVVGGAGGITDRGGNPLTFDVSWFFSTVVPSVSISGVTVAEPIPVPGSTSQATFTVSLSHSSGSTVTVAYATASGTALSGQDFTAASGVLTFAPGVTSLPLSVAVLADGAIETNENFVVNLSTPVNVTISGSQATGVITNTVVPLLGLTTVGSATDTDDSNYLTGSLVTTTWGGIVTSMSVNVGAIDTATANRRYQVAIYTNNAGRPGTLVATSAAATLTANAWNTVALTATLLPNTSYWLIYNTNGRTATVNNMKFNVAAAGQGVYSTAKVTFGTWPATFPASTLTTARYSLYGSW